MAPPWRLVGQQAQPAWELWAMPACAAIFGEDALLDHW